MMSSCAELKETYRSLKNSWNEPSPPPSISDMKIGMTKSGFEYKFSLQNRGVLLSQEKGLDGLVCSIYRYEIYAEYYLLTFCDEELVKWEKDFKQDEVKTPA